MLKTIDEFLLCMTYFGILPLVVGSVYWWDQFLRECSISGEIAF